MMKKRKSIAELIDGILDKKGGGSELDGGDFLGADDANDGHLARLGAAFLARLNIPEGMDEREAAERIIAMWNDAPDRGAHEYEAAAEGGVSHDAVQEEEGEPFEDAPMGVGSDRKRGGRLPAPIRGGLFDAPKADYESMSAEQFRRLKKQLERANMDGRKIRL